MITLYIKDNCPYSRTVLDKVEELGLVVKLKNIKDPKVAAELVEKGGKRQVPYMEDKEHRLSEPCVPCMIDEENNVSLYESKDIVGYLGREYGKVDETI